ncbi:MAG: alpha/beta fold hydrolase [Pseudomonadota bacterium]
MIRERVISFGPNGALFGIATMATEGPRRAPVLIPNAGIVHRVGPHRLHVRLARHLAAAGYPVLRFDLHGLGDSGPPPSELGFEAQAVADIRAALDVMRAEEATVTGLCSGADNAMRVAEADDRIRRLILLDPHAYGSQHAAVARLVEKAADPARWRRAASRLLRGGQAVPPSSGKMQTDDEAERLPIPRDAFARQLLALKERGGGALIRYTDFVQDTLTSPEHFYRAFPGIDFGAGLTVEVERGTDHTYTAMAAQQKLLKRIGEWLEKTECAEDSAS